MISGRLLIAGAVALTALTMTGCGEANDDSKAKVADGASSKTSTAAADLAIAKAAVLTSADLPGYSSKPYKKSDGMPTSAKRRFAECMNAPATLFDDTPGAQKVHSAKFTRDEADVTSAVEIDPHQSDIDNGWEQVVNPNIARCLEGLFGAAISDASPRPGVTFGTPTVTTFDVGIGNRSAGFAITIPASVQGVERTINEDRIYVVRDRAGIDLMSSSLQPLDRTAEIALARKIYDRIGTQAR